ncbi:MAG: methylmalonyl Co-A mutase-associated GTPase MeaB [Propionibacteriales bacterium]|nr:methylmalonyl Co-A mutase-associated GTPase MeaB [Propionibacteriales bacterium]
MSVALDALLAGVRTGQRRAVARTLSLVENDSPHLREVMRRLAPDSGYAHVVGLTGAPGVGKSTTTSELVAELRTAGQRVGVLAIDPSSPFSGGALLGDRIRMQVHSTDNDVLIRSMATRGHLGGLSAATPQALRVLDAARCDTVIVETVGVGQSEVDIADACDTTVVLMAPGMGDSVQAAKAGVLEIGDVYVVNKSDRPGAQAVVRDLRTMIALTERADGAWKPPIVSTVSHTGSGVAELLLRIGEHRAAGEASGAWGSRRQRRAGLEIQALVLGTLRRRLIVGQHDADGLVELARSVREGELDSYTAADRLLEELTN